jgi:hypothetical protein
VTAADFNRDGKTDLAVGPFIYYGPDYQTYREIYLGQTFSVGNSYTNAAVNFAYDYTGDGWPDYIVSAGRAMVLYVNPKGELRRWERYPILPTAAGEVAVFKDIDGDGVPDAVFSGRGGTVTWATPVPGNRPSVDRYQFRRRPMGRQAARRRARYQATGAWTSSLLWDGGSSRRKERRRDRGPIIR